MPSLKQRAFDREFLLKCKGYESKFISPSTPVTIGRVLSGSDKKKLPDVEGTKTGILRYTDLSVLYNAERRVPFVSAYNIDGNAGSKSTRRASAFVPDPRIDESIQLSMDGFYHLRRDITEFEVGHMAANKEMAWGQEAQIKAYQTFHFPNSVPQAEKLNVGIWRSLEAYIIKEAATLKSNKKISVFTGPVLLKDDPAYVEDPDFQIPLLFYKVIVFPTPNGLRSAAFVMSHEKRMREQGMFLLSRDAAVPRGAVTAFDDFKYKKVFQVNVSLLEELSGLNFSWRKVKRISVPEDKQQVKKIRETSDSSDARMHSRGALALPKTSNADLTKKEMRTGNYRLNLVLS